MWSRKKREDALTPHNILGREVLHTVTTRINVCEYLSKCFVGTVVSTTTDPLSNAILITFEDDTSTVWNPNHDAEPLRDRVAESLELL